MAKGEKTIVKNVYFNEDNDVELLEWVNKTTNFSGMVRLLLYEKYNNDKKVPVIQQSPYAQNGNNNFKNNFKKNLKK
jgi:hypothetical protein